MNKKTIIWVLTFFLLCSFVYANNQTDYQGGFIWYDFIPNVTTSITNWTVPFGTVALSNGSLNVTAADSRFGLNNTFTVPSHFSIAFNVTMKAATSQQYLHTCKSGVIGAAATCLQSYVEQDVGNDHGINAFNAGWTEADADAWTAGVEFEYCHEYDDAGGGWSALFKNKTLMLNHSGNPDTAQLTLFSFRLTTVDTRIHSYRVWGGGCQNEPALIIGGGGATVNFTISAQDEWNSTSIISFNATVNGTVYESNASGVINTPISLNNTNAFDILVWGASGYFNRSYSNYNSSLSGALTAELHQAEICFNTTQKVNGSLVAQNNITVEGTTHPSCFNLSADTYNVQAMKTGWYTQNQTFTITPLLNTTLTIQNLSYANLTIYAIDGTTNESLSGYDIRIGSPTSPTFLETATGVTNYSFYLINTTFNTTITMPGYATTTGHANISVSGHTNYTFTLYRANSVTITIRDEITNNLITDNITIRWTSNTTTWENITDTGGLFISNLTATNYTLLFYGSNYSTRTYTITVGNLSTQFLTAYMISSEYSTIFTVKDQDTGDIISDASFTMYKLVNSTWTTVESKTTDITGKVQVYYDPIGNYRFYVAKTDYEDLIFYLNPILFNTYDVFMVKSSLLNYSVDYDDISIVYSPHSFDNNENTSFNFLISSPDGLLTTYGITLTYPGGSDSASGVNAIGEQLSAWVNITNATRWDTVKLEYNYTTSLAGTRTFTQYLTIRTNATASENTWTANKDRTFGLGLFERVLIVTIIVIFAVGIASMVGQPIPGAAIGLFLFGFMVKIGFIPIWSILPSMFVGFLFLVWKSGR